MSHPKEPIVFKSPGLKPDIRLNVFGQEFHAHSAVLKLYSAFFRTFLDSPEKTPAPASALFRYDYVSVVDDDGTWGLEPVEMAQPKQPDIAGNELKSVQTKELETTAFQKVLCALYSKLYHVESVNELGAITWLASFYCALPMVSTSLYIALYNSPKLVKEISSASFEVMVYAQELRHPVLFREALIHTVSQRAKLEPETFAAHRDLWGVIEMAHNRLSAKVLEALYHVIASITSSPTETTTFYRRIYDSWPKGVSPSQAPGRAQDALGNILSSNLTLCSADQAAVEDHSSKFMCASIEDSELPWDLDAEDW